MANSAFAKIGVPGNREKLSKKLRTRIIIERTAGMQSILQLILRLKRTTVQNDNVNVRRDAILDGNQ